MKIGIVTSSNGVDSIQLLLYLLNNSIEIESVYILKRSIWKSFRRNIRISGVRLLRDLVLNIIKRKDDTKKGEKSKDIIHDFITKKGIELNCNSLLDVCREKGIKVESYQSINEGKAIRSVKDDQIDILINAGGGIYRSKIIDAVSIGIFNTHMGYLPDFRGMNVMEWSIFYKRKIGVTLHFIDKGIDTGDVILFKELKIEENDTIFSLRAKSRIINMVLFTEGIKKAEAGNINRIKQRNEDGKQYFIMHPRLMKIVESNIIEYQKNNEW